MSLANPINASTGGLSQDCWKRKGSEKDNEDIESNVKKARYDWYVTLESESPQATSSDEDDESIYSVQELETEFVQDTSDTSTNTWITSSDGEIVHVEYEVASLSEDDNPFIDGLSSSDSEDIIREVMIPAAIYDSDLVLADDSDDSRSSRDSEISHPDYRTCVQCNASNNNPLFRHCEKCYRTRKTFYPPRPKGRKRRGRTSRTKSDQVQSLEGHELTTMDSGLGCSQISQPSLSFELRRMGIERVPSKGEEHASLTQESTDTVDCGFSSQPSAISLSQSSEMTISQPSTSSQFDSQDRISSIDCEDSTRKADEEVDKMEDGKHESSRSLATTLSIDSRESNLSDSSQDVDTKTSGSGMPIDLGNNLCMICTVGPKNGIFVHGKSTHICCCYRCAKRVWKTTKHCPMCNRKVMNVLKAYYA